MRVVRGQTACVRILVGCLPLALALLVACGEDSASTSSSDAAAVATTLPAYVVPGGGELTDRQLEMVTMVDQYSAAWQATDGDAVAALMTPDGYIEYPEDEAIFRVSDGTVQSRVTNGPYSTLTAVAPMAVYGDRIVLFGSIDALSLEWLSVVKFTTSGDLRIRSETIFHWGKAAG